MWLLLLQARFSTRAPPQGRPPPDRTVQAPARQEADSVRSAGRHQMATRSGDTCENSDSCLFKSFIVQSFGTALGKKGGRLATQMPVPILCERPTSSVDESGLNRSRK